MPATAPAPTHDPAIEEHLFADDGLVPNNPSLPLMVYRGVLEPGPEAADRCTARFAANGWGGAWRNGVYPHHHYHGTAHEALGIATGSARVRLGGERGEVVSLQQGDVVVIPAGVAHKCEGASPDLLVVGAYPRGQNPDLRTPGVRERERALHDIARVPLPLRDPVYGENGPLIRRWKRTKDAAPRD
ncbi:MAG TPA: cupin domain-containing protein [Stellaceae bacterium]